MGSNIQSNLPLHKKECAMSNPLIAQKRIEDAQKAKANENEVAHVTDFRSSEPSLAPKLRPTFSIEAPSVRLTARAVTPAAYRHESEKPGEEGGMRTFVAKRDCLIWRSRFRSGTGRRERVKWRISSD
jgi:hypothetical protein